MTPTSTVDPCTPSPALERDVDERAERERMNELALEIRQAGKRLALFEADRRHGDDKYGGNVDAIVSLEHRIANEREKLSALEDEFATLRQAALARAEAKRAAAAAAREAARPRLERRWAELEQERQAALVEVEKHLAALAQAVAAALAPEPELHDLGRELGDRSGRAYRSAIEARLKWTLVRVGPLFDLDPMLGAGASEPLVEPARTDDSGRNQAGKRRNGDRLPRSSTDRCLTCAHPERQAIEEALAVGVPLRKISEQFGLGRSALSRHKGHATKTLRQRRRKQTVPAG